MMLNLQVNTHLQRKISHSRALKMALERKCKVEIYMQIAPEYQLKNLTKNAHFVHHSRRKSNSVERGRQYLEDGE